MNEELVIDNFRLGNCIATGSTSQIYEVFDQESNERFAMKLLLDEAFKVAENRAVLKREFKIASGLDHPNLIPVYAHRQSRKSAYFVMEFFGGPNLKQIIRGDPAVIHARFRKLFECILLGLGQMHAQGWLHRDLKPDNIMMSKATDVRIIDFSLSSRIPSAMAKLFFGGKKQIQGTRTYIAPEIVRRKHPCIQSDIYSLGVTAFECLTGRPPFMGSTPNDLLIKHIQEAPPEPSAYNPNITPEMDKLIARMLAKKIENRPGSAAELLSEFRTIRIFKEDPDDFARQKAIVDEQKNSFTEDGMLDSRADAARQEQKRTTRGSEPPQAVSPAAKPVAKPAVAPAPAAGKGGPPPGGQSPAPRAPQGAPRPADPRAAAPVGQPQPPGFSPAGYPQQGYPPGYPQPGYPQQFPPGQYPGGMPPQNWPAGQQPVPGNPQPGGQGRPAPAPARSQNPPPAAKSAPAPPKPAPPKPKQDDLPFADELPDIA